MQFLVPDISGGFSVNALCLRKYTVTDKSGIKPSRRYRREETVHAS